MRDAQSILAQLTRLYAEYETANGSVIAPTGGKDRAALLRLSEVAGQLACIHEDVATEMNRVCRQAHDLAMTK